MRWADRCFLCGMVIWSERFSAHSMKRDSVLSSMSQKDFEELCRSIEGSITKVMNAVGKGIDKAGDAATNAINQAMENQKRQQQNNRPDAPGRAPSTAPVRANNAIYRQNYANNAIIRSRFKPAGGLTASGVLLSTVGGIFTFTFGATEIFGISTAIISPTSEAVGSLGGYIGALGVIAAFLGLSVWGLVTGVRNLTLGARLKAIQRIFGDREVCSIQELSERMQISPEKTVDTVRKLIKRGLLPQGRLDSGETCLMVTNASYDLYLQAKHSYEQKKMEERAMQSAKARSGLTSQDAAMNAKAQAFIDTGNRYIQEISALNVAIDDVELSEKIVQIELIIGKILDRVKDDPSLIESVSGIGRLDDYYLPQTIKLLTAYEQLEEQPVQGENIRNSRREIEATLDTLCTAYDKLLDSTFEDLTMDVSSDITVLHAVLSQEGLTENPFDGDDAGKRNSTDLKQ